MSKFRRFESTYSVHVPEFSSSAKSVSVWVPFPTETRDQEIHSIDVECSADYDICYDSTYGNRMLRTTVDTSVEKSLTINIVTTATRFERSTNFHEFAYRDGADSPQAFRAQLTPNRLIKFSPEIVEIANAIKVQHSGSVAIARAAYEHVLEHMKYDKTGDGWGSGDAEFACSIGKGNCTDFHSLFLAIIRACGVPGQFEIGMAFPTGMTGGDITAFKCGYHCWTSFYAHGIGWIPVDCSEAAQKLGLRDYFFGSIDENRFLLSVGRDLILPGREAREPVNFFTEPVIETDQGTAVYYEKKLSFKTI